MHLPPPFAPQSVDFIMLKKSKVEYAAGHRYTGPIRGLQVVLDWGKWLVLDIHHIYNLPYQGGSHLVLCQFSYPLPHWINFLSHSFPKILIFHSVF